MEILNIEHDILAALYEEWDQSDDGVNLFALCNQKGWNQIAFEKVLSRLENDGYIKCSGLSFFEITPDGVIKTEEDLIVSMDQCKGNIEARDKLLDGLFDIYDDAGPDNDCTYEDLSIKTGVEESQVLKQLEVLKKIGYLDEEEVGCFRLSNSGITKMEEIQSQRKNADEFVRISEMEPHSRGRVLQKYLAKILEHEGWSQIEGARTSNEEIDVVLFRDREYYLIECKWEKEPTENSDILKFSGNLINRADVRGIFVSMSGFSKGSEKQIHDFANIRIILLFGPEDINSITYRRAKFDDLLNEKYRELTVYKKVLWQ